MVSTSRADVDAHRAGREMTVSRQVRTALECTAHNTDAVSTADVSAMPDSPASTVSTVTTSQSCFRFVERVSK